MSQVRSNVIKQRAQRHQRLLRMIKGYQRSHQDEKMLHKIKLDTIFQINLRYRRCQINKIYKFPKSSDLDQQATSQQNQLYSDKQLSYNLFSQNNSYQSTHYQKNSLSKLMQIDQKINSKHKNQDSNNPSRVNSLGRTLKRYSKQRIDRIEKMEKTFKKQKIKTERMETQRNQAFRQQSKLYIINKNNTIKKQQIRSQVISLHHSNNLKNTVPVHKIGNYKISRSPQVVKSQDSKIKNKLRTEEPQLLTLKKVAGKKLLTQEIETNKKGKIHNFISNQIKKVQKTTILKQIATQKLKSKNLFHKKIF